MAVVSLLFTLACGGSAQPSSTGPKAGGTLKVAQESELRTLDPHASSQLVEREVFYQMYDSLVTVDTKLTIQAGLATSWSYGDPTTLTFNLRKGVKFHDGTAFDASVVKFNIDRIKKDPRSPRFSEIASVDSVEVKDANTAVFHLKKPDAALLATLVDRAGMMISPAAVAKAGASFGLNPLGAGTGPFMFVEWKRDDHLTLKKNPNYWQAGKPLLDELIFRVIIDPTARFTALRTGDVDVVRQIAGNDVATARTDSNVVYKDAPGLGFGGFYVNSAKPPFNDVSKKKAVAMALDRAQILKNVFFGVGTVAHGPIPPSSWAFDASEKIYDKADPNGAKSVATGFSFELKTTNNPDSVQEAQLIKDQLAKAGITVKISVEEFGQILNEDTAGNFQASLVGWSGRIDPDGNMYNHYRTDGGFNDGKYSNPQVDKLLEQARASTEQSQRRQYYQQAQRTLVEEVAYVFINHPNVMQVTTGKVHGFTLYADGMFRFAGVSKS
ncbi:MAG TPA: ABC transporter substrate-binding protein [Candidatus Acidoferrales bacterium]|nr:ABC transporter substrate-binding protein [Candidatus Acidoferrales bacterium]